MAAKGRCEGRCVGTNAQEMYEGWVRGSRRDVHVAVAGNTTWAAGSVLAAWQCPGMGSEGWSAEGEHA